MHSHLTENLSGFQFCSIMNNVNVNVSVSVFGTQAQSFKEYIQGRKTAGPYFFLGGNAKQFSKILGLVYPPSSSS